MFWYANHKRDRYQTHFVVAGVALSLVIGLLSRTTQEVLVLGYGVWGAIISLALSALWHRLVTGRKENALGTGAPESQRQQGFEEK